MNDRPASDIARTVALVCAIVSGATSLSSRVFAQTATATLTGTAMDESQAMVSQVQITITNLDTRIERRTLTNSQGFFSVPFLPPGRYTVAAEREGFSRVEARDVVLNVDDQRSVMLQLKVGSISDSVVVIGSRAKDVESVAVTTVVDREFLEAIPLNGRSLHGLLELTPGTVLVAGQGQFSVNGQRDNANYFAVDGVGANTGIAARPSLGPSAGGTVPAFGALGSTTSMVSVDAVQEFRVETSSYAAEFGRTPGAQVSLVTRSGTNAVRGSVFEYVRSDAFDANDWFVDSLGLPKPPMRQNDFGGVTGGPIVRDRTFFFISYEGLRLQQPKVGITPVPTVAARQNAPVGIRPYLNAFPLPNGRLLGNEMAEFSASYSNASVLNATGIRVDHSLGRGLSVFGRYSETSSEASVRGGEGSFNALSSLNGTQVDARSATFGATQTFGASVTHELRLNASQSTGQNTINLDGFGGAVPPADSQLFPAFTSRADAIFSFLLFGPSAGYNVGKNVDNRQRQFNLVDSVSMVKGAHQLKAGVDYRRLSPVLDVLKYGQQASFNNGALGALTGQAASVQIFSTPSARYPLFANLSAYVQDVWRASERLTLTTGLRWEWNPPPAEANGQQAYTVVGLDNPATMKLAPAGTPLWNTTFDNFAPRVGAAYQLWKSNERESVVRGGAGIFYDLGSGPIGSAFSQTAFSDFSFKPLANLAFPLDPSLAQPAAVSTAPPYQNVVVADPNLELPRVYQWNAALEQTITRGQILSVSYVGAAGRRLLRGETLATSNPDFGNVSVVRNGASSDYRALQLQYRHLLSRGLQALASYTWAQSTDNASTESFGFVPAALLDPTLDRGPSDFDIRHSFSAAVTYLVPSAAASGPVRTLTSDWSVDAIVMARSAAPINVVAQGFLLGVRQAARPDLVPDVPIYLADPTAPGGMRLNSAAFATPSPGRQGTLGRNALRGFPVAQLDVAVRRRLHLPKSRTLEIGADIFNVINHPNFANPDPFLSDGPLFGRSSSMFGQSVGGLNSLYQLGGPRSIQLFAKTYL